MWISTSTFFCTKDLAEVSMSWYRAEESGKCYWQRFLCLPSSIWSPLGSPGQNWLWLPVWFYFCLWTCCPPAQHSMVWRTTEAPTEISKVLHSPRDLSLLSSWRWLWLFWRPADRTVSVSGKWGGSTSEPWMSISEWWMEAQLKLIIIFLVLVLLKWRGDCVHQLTAWILTALRWPLSASVVQSYKITAPQKQLHYVTPVFSSNFWNLHLKNLQEKSDKCNSAQGNVRMTANNIVYFGEAG